MIILDLEQGSDIWSAKRREHNTASEAPAMMGKSKHMSRSELVRMKATGVEIEYNNYVKDVVFKEGQRVEALARPLAEEIIGETLFPVVATNDDGYLLASFDGLTMDETIVWETKQWNEEKAGIVREQNLIPEGDIDQVIQQLVVSRAERCLYMITDGTEEKTVSCWYSLKPGDVTGLLAGWKQLDDDVENYQHVEPVVEAVGKAPDTLPALRIEVTGMVTDSNLIEFKSNAMAVIDTINTELVTDEDFANAKETVKWLKGIEQKLDNAKQNALSQTQSIDELFRAIDDIKDISKKKRTNLNSTVTVREKARKEEIVMSGKYALTEYIEHKNLAFGKPYMPTIIADFPGAVHGLKLMSKREDAVATELARAKIEANKAADKIQTNLDSLRELASEHKFLFPDTKAIILKDNDDLVSLIKVRIADHKEENKGKQIEKECCEHSDSLTQKNNKKTADRPKIGIDDTTEIIRVSLVVNGVDTQSAKKIATLLVSGKISNVSVIILE